MGDRARSLSLTGPWTPPVKGEKSAGGGSEHLAGQIPGEKSKGRIPVSNVGRGQGRTSRGSDVEAEP